MATKRKSTKNPKQSRKEDQQKRAILLRVFGTTAISELEFALIKASKSKAWLARALLIINKTLNQQQAEIRALQTFLGVSQPRLRSPHTKG